MNNNKTAMKDPELRTIRVYGTLAKLLKRRTFQAVVRSPLDAINFLLSNFPELQAYIEPRAFQIIVNDKPINEHQLATPVDFSADRIHIIPAICGAGGNNNTGLVSILAGAALIGASFLFPLAAPILLPLGIGLVLTGAAALIAPVTPEAEERSDPSLSYVFNGVQNTSREGVAVPCVYGEIVTGSILISLGTIEDEQELEPIFTGGEGDPLPELFPFPQGGTNIQCSRYWRFEGTNTPRIDKAAPDSCCEDTYVSPNANISTSAWNIDFGLDRNVCFETWVIEGYPQLSKQILNPDGSCCTTLFCREDINITYKEQFGDDFYRSNFTLDNPVDSNTVLWRSNYLPGYTSGRRSVLHARMSWGNNTIIVDLANGTSGGIGCIENEWSALSAIPTDENFDPL